MKDAKNEQTNNDDDDSGQSGLVAPFAGEYTVVDGAAHRDTPASDQGRRRSAIPAWLRTSGGRRQTIELVVRRAVADVRKYAC